MDSKPTQKVYLVVGGCGFLGRYMVEALLNRGEKNVRVFDLRKTFDNEGVQFTTGDITNLDNVINACKGVDVVIHTASPTVHDQKYDFFFKVNVQGTQNVIDACQKCGVKQLIYTSSASVIFSGDDIRNADETTPYCKTYFDPYNLTKKLAEERVLAANGNAGVMTCSIRPSGIFGPRDVQGWPGFMSNAKGKILNRWSKSIIQIGDGSNLFDWTYVENIVHAHLLASDKLVSGSPIGGQAYFITNGEPTPFWDMANYVYKNFGYPETSLKLPYGLMYVFSVVVMYIALILSPIVKLNPTFTPMRICNSGATKTFSIEKAKKDFGYKPLISLEEGKRRTLEYFKEERSKGRF